MLSALLAGTFPVLLPAMLPAVPPVAEQAALQFTALAAIQAGLLVASTNQAWAQTPDTQESGQTSLGSIKKSVRGQPSGNYPKATLALQPLGIARPDSAYRYLAEKGAAMFRNGRFAEAEDYYRAALKNAEHERLNDRRLAMLVTNLATDLRQQQKYDEAEPLFERAVRIERKSLKKDEALMLYTARQYAGLLRETARDASAEAVMEAARNNFAIVPTNSRNFLTADPEGVNGSVNSGVNEGVNGSASNENNSRATSDERREFLGRRTSGKERAGENDKDYDQESLETRARLRKLAQSSDSGYAILGPPISRPDMSVTAELRMLADIERTYQDETMQSSQMLPSTFSYMTGGPLYSSPGFSGVVFGGGFAGGFGVPTRTHRGGGGSGGGSGHHR